MENYKRCKIADCEGNAHWRAKGALEMCSAHYTRHSRHGDPLSGRVTPGSVKKWILDNLDHKGNACLEWPFAKNKNGYAVCQNYIKGSGMMSAARYMLILKDGEPENSKNQTRHKCGKGHLACVNPTHLEWGTVKENMHDKKRDGTETVGERNGYSRFKAEDIKKIRELYKTMNQTEIGKIYNVDRGHIGLIVNNKIWKDA